MNGAERGADGRCHAPIDGGEGGLDAGSTDTGPGMDARAIDALALDGRGPPDASMGADAGPCPPCSSPTPHCDERRGECVECLSDAHCGDFSCNPMTLECTTTMRGSLYGCEACVTDSECGSVLVASLGPIVMRCVESEFRGALVGTFCILDATTIGCLDPYTALREATSVGGVTADYCFPSENLTSCPAILDAQARVICAETAPKEGLCGDAAVPDGLCRPTGTGSPSACTIRCTSNDGCEEYFADAVCNVDVAEPYCCHETGASAPVGCQRPM